MVVCLFGIGEFALTVFTKSAFRNDSLSERARRNSVSAFGERIQKVRSLFIGREDWLRRTILLHGLINLWNPGAAAFRQP
jgi:hypothetical protein